MAVDRSVIGLTSEPVVNEVEKGAIRKFAEAIGDPNPVYAQGEIAPPTFPTTFRTKLPITIELKRVLHGGQEFEYERPIRAGDVITVVSRVVDVVEKHGKLGAMTIYTVESEGTDAEGQLVYRGRSTIISR